MTNNTVNHSNNTPETPLRRPWVTPRMIVGECGDSEAGNGIYASDVATESINLTGS